MKKTALISAFAAALLCLIIFSACNGSVNLSNTLWVPDSANNASGDEVDIRENIAMVSAVGRKMSSQPGVSGRLFKALGDEGINIRTIAQGADELAITVGVDNKDFETAIRVLYNGFAG